MAGYMEAKQSLRVVHNYPVWLPKTMTWLHNQVVELERLGVNNTILCERVENQDLFGDVNLIALSKVSRIRRVWELGLRKTGFRNHLEFYLRALKNSNVDLLHSHFGPVGWANLVLARRLGIPHVVTFYGSDVNMLPKQDHRWKRRYSSLFNSANLFLCEGPHMAKMLVQQGCPKDKIKVHHFGIDLDNIPYRPRQWKPGDILKVLLAATFREKKGLIYAIESLGRIQSKIPLEITIIGEATQEPRSIEERRSIILTLNKTGLMEKTRLLGFQPQEILWKEAFEHHLFFSPSVTATDGDTEGGAPVCLMEMIASGMPVVSTTHCDIPFVLGDEMNPYLAPEKDVDKLVNILNDIISGWPAVINRVEASRRRMELNFNLKIRTSHLLDEYLSLSGKDNNGQ